MATPREVYSHNYQHFEDLQLSGKEFYAEIVRRIREYEYPDVASSSRLIRESSFLSSRRQYLCIYRGELEFLVCAAPFGRSFFISWYMEERRDPVREFMQRLPLVGWMFRPAPKTYYQLDTELIFVRSIDAIVRSVIQKVMVEHGFRVSDPQSLNE